MAQETLKHKNRPASILIVEDNLADMIMMKRAFRMTQVTHELTFAWSGEEALSMLQKEGEFADMQQPDLILLDLNLPRVSGLEVLSTIKSAQDLRHIPVVIVSSSSAEQDVAASYNLYANSYIVKPVSIDDFTAMAQKIEQFWFSLTTLA